jgi:hypothetical protein
MATALSAIGLTFWSVWRFRRSFDVEESWFDTILLADLFQSTVKSLIGQDMAQPPPKHWQNFGSPSTRNND